MYNEKNFIKKAVEKLKALKKKAMKRGLRKATWKAFKKRYILKVLEIIIRKRREG